LLPGINGLENNCSDYFEGAVKETFFLAEDKKRENNHAFQKICMAMEPLQELILLSNTIILIQLACRTSEKVCIF